MTTRDEGYLSAALWTGALIVGVAAFAWWVTYTPAPAEAGLMARRVHFGGLFFEVKHMIALALGLVTHLIWVVLTPIVAYKKWRHMWALEGLLLGFCCGPFGCLIEWLLLADLSNGRERPLSGILSGR